MTDAPPANSYDLAPYPRLSHYFCHPGKAATLAHLLGLTPPPVEHSRVLELGCAGGGNLIPLAVAFPHSTFVGVDLSSRQVADGRADIQRLGLNNIALYSLDLQAIDRAFGQFDYILAHGLYSWVPRPVRDRLLAICQENLVPEGVAYVSYNTYPGWHGLEAIRRMMLYHVREITEPAERAAKARALLDFLAGAADPTDHYGAMLTSRNKLLHEEANADDNYLLHEYLEEVNEPVYFHEFAEHAARHGLQYLCDAEFHLNFLTTFPKGQADTLRQMSRDSIELEQYMDFVRNRTFRPSLLVHADQPVHHWISAAQLQTLWVASPARSESNAVSLSQGAVETFRGLGDASLSINHALSKAAMVCLIQRWPAPLPFDALVAEAQARLAAVAGEGATGPVTQQQIEVLAGNLLLAFTYSESLVQFQACAPRFTLDVGGKPLASPWARLQAEAGPGVTNLRHERVTLEPLDLQLLRRLDGTRDRAALLAEFEPPGLEGRLAGLARAALLIQP